MSTFHPSSRSNPDYSFPGYSDGRMVRGFLYNIEKDARELQQVLTDDDQLPQWVSMKIYTAEDRLASAARYMEREAKLAKSGSARKNPDPATSRTLGTIAFLVLAGFLVRSRMK